MLHNRAPLVPLSQNIPAGGNAATAGRPGAGLHTRVAALNARYRHHGATDVIRAALSQTNRIALVSSFGAESVTLLHLVAMQDRNVPVIFIDTEMLFTETLVYQQELGERLGLRNITIIRSADIQVVDSDATLHRTNPDACCALRKTEPLERALAAHDGWITGRKRFQSGSRAALEFFEVERGTGRIKVNPLAHWTPVDVLTYMDENRLPRHPLSARGYPSLGCIPCTSPVAKGEDPRAGRWRDQTKEECGIHLVNGKMLRTGVTT